MFGTTLTRYFYNSRDCTTLESSMAPIQRFKHHRKVSHSRLTLIVYLYLILSKSCRVSRLCYSKFRLVLGEPISSYGARQLLRMSEASGTIGTLKLYSISFIPDQKVIFRELINFSELVQSISRCRYACDYN